MIIPFVAQTILDRYDQRPIIQQGQTGCDVGAEKIDAGANKDGFVPNESDEGAKIDEFVSDDQQDGNPYALKR